MFNVLDRLDKVRKDYPKKYQRIVDRLDEIRRSGATGAVSDGDDDDEGPDATTDNYTHLAKVRKATDDFFSRLATVDRKNEEFWRHVGGEWAGRTELDDLPQAKIPPPSDEESLIRTILLSHHPRETFKLMLEFNHPQKILHKLLLSHDKRSLLYGVRTKFNLPLGTHLTPKQNFFARASMAGASTMDIHAKHVHHHHHHHEEERMFPQRDSFVDHLVNRAPHVNDFNEDATIKDLLGTSVFHAPEHLLKVQSTASERGLHVKQHTSLLQISSKETDMLKSSSSTSNRSAKKSPQNVKSENSRYGDALSTFSDVERTSKVSFDPEDRDRSSSSSSSSSSSGDEANEAGGEDSADTGGMDQYRLQRLKIIFEESDTDDEPGLDINEFKQAMKKIMGEDVTDREIELTFMKVDANCDGNVDWAEFLEFTLREFQERDLMTQLTKDAFFEKSPTVIPATKSQKEIRALVFVRQQGFGKSVADLTNGRYYSLNVDGQTVCWTADFKKIATFELITDTRGISVYVHANDLVAIPEIKTLVVSFTTGELHFYSYDDTKLDLVFSISCLKSPVLCMHYCFNEAESVLLLGDQMGQVGVIRFRNLQYEGLWGSLALPHSNNPKVPWSTLKTRNSAFYLKDVRGTDWINQVKFFPNLNAVMSCSLDPKCSLCVIPFHKQRDPIYFAHKEGFNCFDYSDFLNVIVTGSKNRSIQVWNQDNVLTPTGHFDGHEGPINRVVVYKDADFTVLISVDSLHVLKVWDFKDQACLQSYDARADILHHHSTMLLVYNSVLEHVVLGARDMLVLKRVSRSKKGPVDPVQKTHAQPIVGMLYNELFECVVTSCLESTIMVWNFQTGEKIIQFRNAHTVEENGKTVQIPIKSMCFDANQRRLLTCASDGLVKLWNFNNGACLSFFDHLEDIDLNVVRYQKNRDLVIAAGWNKYVFMVRDTRGEDDVEETVYEWGKYHRSDITALELIYGPDDDDDDDDDDEEEKDSLTSSNQSNSRTDSVIESSVTKDQDSQTLLSGSDNSLTEEQQEAIKSFVSIMHSDDSDEVDEGNDLAEQPFVFNADSETLGVKSRGAGPSFNDVGCNTSCGYFSVTESSSIDLTAAFSKPLTGDEDTNKKGSEESKSGDGESGESEEESADGSESGGEEERKKLSDDASYIVTGCADGELIVWHVFSGQPICFLNTDGCPFALTKEARAEYAASTVVDFPKVEMKDSGSIENFLTLQVLNHQKNNQRHQAFPDHEDLIEVPKVAPQARNCITAILILRNRVFDDGKTASILTSSTDGFIRAWSIEFTTGGLLGLFYAAHEFDSFVTTMYTDEKNELLFTADTRGYIKIYLLCEWMQSPVHLADHRHCIDPRNFPFIKRRKIFAMLIAFRANYMMKRAVEILPQTQRGLYKQPVILNSFRGHLLRVTQIQVVFAKKIIITASEDCSVRLWHFSGLYIGTLGQEAAFKNDAIPTEELPNETSPETLSTSKASRSTNTSALSADDIQTSTIEAEVTNFLHEDEDPNEVLLKPKVIIPHDIAEKGSLATLQVLYSDRHKRTVIPAYIEEAEQSKTETESASQTAWFESKEDYMEALGELAVEKNKFEELKTAPVRFYADPHEGMIPSAEEVNDEETLIFNQQPLQEVEPVGGLDTVIPKNLYGYHLNKVQEELLEALPVELRKPYVDLKEAGLLVGPALDELRAVIQQRQQSLARPRLTAIPKNRNMEKRVRMKEIAKSVIDVQKVSKLQKQFGQENRGSKNAGDYSEKGNPVSMNEQKGDTAKENGSDRLRSTVFQALARKTTQKRQEASGDQRNPSTLANIVTALRSSSKAPGSLLNPADIYMDEEDQASRRSGVQSMSDRGSTAADGHARKSTKSPGLKDRSSQESVVELNDEFLNADRIDIGQLRSSEEEFVEDLMREQERNAKFDYLALLEGGMARPSQIEQYMPIVQNDGELFNEIKPMLQSRNLFDVRASRPSRKRVTVKTAKSVSSMDRIQRVFKVPDFNGQPPVKDTSKELHLNVPPAPRRLPSVIKGQVRNGQRKTSFYNFHELDEAPSPLGGTQLWGDQESLAIFDLDIEALQTHNKPPAALPEDSAEIKDRKKQKEKTTDISRALHRREKPLPKQRPFTNRYIYRQLSDSVLHQPIAGEGHSDKVAVDLGAYVASRKNYKEQEAMSKKETKRLNQELHETQRRSLQASKAKSAAKKKQEAMLRGMANSDRSLRDLSKMLDEVNSAEMDFVQENLSAQH